MVKSKPIDHDKRRRIEEQADEIAGILGIDAEEVMFDRYGVSLTPAQADRLIALAKGQQ